jgi:hypothetical protein
MGIIDKQTERVKKIQSREQRRRELMGEEGVARQNYREFNEKVKGAFTEGDSATKATGREAVKRVGEYKKGKINKDSAMDKDRDTTSPDPREAEVVEAMILDSMEYIHGKGFEPIVKELKTAADPAATMATIAYKCVRGVAEKNKATAQVDMDMDMMMGVTTECIDMVVEVAEAANEIPRGTNVEQLKQDTLLRVTALHGDTLEQAEGGFTDDMKLSAQADMRDYIDSPGAQKALDYVNERAAAEGLNPNAMMRQGQEMLIEKDAIVGVNLPRRTPVAEGVQQGLMQQQQPPPTQEATYQVPPGSEQYQAQEDMMRQTQGGGLMVGDQPPMNTPPPVGYDDAQMPQPSGTPRRY